MLLTIHNLPSSCRYADIKNILIEKCGLSEIALDNLVSEGKGKKVTVGLANDDDGALVVRKINGLILHGNELYIEDRRRKTGEHDQPHRASTGLIQEARSIDPTHGNSLMGGMAANVPMMWNYNMAVPYMVQVPVEQNFAYAGYGGAPQAAQYMEPKPVVPAENERGYSGFQAKSYPPGNRPKEQEPGAWGRSGRERGSESYRHQDSKRHHSPERPTVPQKRGSRLNEKEAPKRREPSSPHQQWPQDMNRSPSPPLRQPEEFARVQDRYQTREPKSDYRAPEPQWENRWDAPKPHDERDREWDNTNNQNWEPEPHKTWENQPNQNWRDQPMQGNKNVVPERVGKYSQVRQRDDSEWFDRQPEKQMDQYRGDKFYEPDPVEHESRPRQRDADWNDRRPQNDRDALRRPQNDRDAPRCPQNYRDARRHPENDRDAPRRPQNERDVLRRPVNDVPRRPLNDWDAPRQPQIDRDVPKRSQNDRDAPRRPRDDRDAPRRLQNDMDSVRKWSRGPGGPGATRSISSSNRNSRRDEPPRRDRSRSNNAPQRRDYREDRRNHPQDLPGGARENPDYRRQIANEHPEPKKPEYRYKDFNAPRHEQNQSYMPDIQKKPAMREERDHPYPTKPHINQTKKKPQTLTALINRDSYNRGEATSTIAKLMFGIKSKTEISPYLDAYIFKQLKLCIKARIDVLLGEELSLDTDEVIKRYRVKFPVSGDKVLLQQIREKSTEEYELMQGQRRMNNSNPVTKEPDNVTHAQNNIQNAATADEIKQPEATDVVKNNAMLVVAASKVPGPKLREAKKNKPLTDMKLQWEYNQDNVYSLDAGSKNDDAVAVLDKFVCGSTATVKPKTTMKGREAVPAREEVTVHSAKMGAAAGRNTASGRNAGAGPSNGGSGSRCHVGPIHFKAAVRPVKRGHAKTGTARGPNAAGAGGAGSAGMPKPTTVPSRRNLPNPVGNASANVGAPKPLSKGAQINSGYILTKRQKRRQNARERARLSIHAAAGAPTETSTIEANVGHNKRPLGSSADSSLLASAPQRTTVGSYAAERMAIIPVGYPAERILAEHIPAIQGAVLALVDGKSSPLPRIMLGNIVGGALHISCHGRGASTWFSSVIGREEIAGLRLKVVDAKDLPKPVKMAWKTRIVGVQDLKLMLRVLQRYYPLLQTEHWKIVDTSMGETSSRRIVFMDRQSADVIKGEGYQLFSGVDLNSFKLLEDVEREANPRAGLGNVAQGEGVASESSARAVSGDVYPETIDGDAEDVRADDAPSTDNAEAVAPGADIKPDDTVVDMEWTDWPESRVGWESWPISAGGSEDQRDLGAPSPMVSEEAH